ncbi:BLUF domain/cyclic diguanylate phosphodiesterase [Raoultella terrigena]|nr:BLUF domain/cyclic diguanylate phosphodiesterase [Raoultella terrigena]
MLTTLIYRSQLAPAWQPTSLGTLVSRARQKNTNLHVTGILIFSGSQFFQVLEGDEQVVDALFSQIRNDPRHTDVVELMRDYSAYRRFRDIGMHLFDLQLNKPGR